MNENTPENTNDLTNDNRKPLTVHLSEREMKVLEQLGKQRGLSKSAVMRRALRLYQIIEIRMLKGEQLIFEHGTTKERSGLIVL